MRAAAAICVLFMLAGCGEGGLSPLPVMQASASFPKLGIANVIVVDAVDRLALTDAVLVAPDGKVTQPTDLDVRPRPRMGSQRLLGSGAFEGEMFAPAETPTPTTGSPVFPGGAPNATSHLLAVISTASIPVPDPVDYRLNWQKYRIRLTFGRPPGEVEERQLAAPPPAAALPPRPAR
jgi:hypothetical protein